MEENPASASASSQTNRPSLFPAYASFSINDHAQDEGTKPEWLCNRSFTADTYQASLNDQKVAYPSVEEIKEIELNDDESPKKKPKKKKKKKSERRAEDKEIKKIVPSSSSAESCVLQSYLNKLTFIEDTGLSDERAFRVDTKPDYEMPHFLSFDRKAIAKYKQKVMIPVGASNAQVKEIIDSIAKKKAKRMPRYFSKQSLKFLKDCVGEGEIPVRSSKEFMQPLPKYLPIQSSSDSFVIDQNFMGYIDRVPAAESEPSTSKADIFSVVKDELQKKTEYFNNTLTESPHNEQLWLNFVDFQHKFFQSQPFSKSEHFSEKSVIEKQIAILDKALIHNPTSVHLAVARLKLLRNLEEPEALISQWEKLIFYHPNDTTVWQQYLLFVMSDISYFTISRISKVYKKCFKTLSNIEQGVLKSHPAPPGLIYKMIEIFGDLCMMFYNCGHTERAVGSFQAFAEFNLFPPAMILYLSSNSDCVAMFEPFWDCGSARLGEKNALGWSITMIEKKVEVCSPFRPGLSDLEDQILSLKLPEWKLWLQFEKLRESNHWLPWRPDPSLDQTNDDVDDPDRIVTFDHVSKFLFRVEHDKAKFFLLCEFLAFCGVTIHNSECSHFPKRSEKSLLLLENFNYLHSIFQDIFPNKKVPKCLLLRQNDLCGHFDFIENAFNLANEAFTLQYRKLLSLLYLRYNINRLLQPAVGQPCRQSIKNLKKVAKLLLKKSENRNSLFLWCEYIYVEWLSGDRDSADQMFEKLFSKSSDVPSLDLFDYRGLCFFARKYIEMCTGIKQCNEIKPKRFEEVREKFLVILVQLGSKEKYEPSNLGINVSPAMLVKSIMGFKNFIKCELSDIDVTSNCLCKCLEPEVLSVIDCIICGIYLHYFGRGIEASLQFVEETVKLLNDKAGEKPTDVFRYVNEQILVCKVELLNFHANNFPGSLKTFRLNLYDAVSNFPSNIRLLHLLVKSRTASAVVGPTRRFFFDLLDTCAQLSPLTWLFAILFEFSICCAIQAPLVTYEEKENDAEMISSLRNLGIMWKIRSLFEKCLKSSSSRYCVALWRLYIQYEILNGEVSKALAIFHNALQNCAWSKALLLDGIEYFNEEHHRLVEMMIQKQLRVRTPLEEIQLLAQHASSEIMS